ncbi:MAG: NAD(P)/FAD-dependent oxidoreductase [Eisenbergiella sp.]
MKEKIAVIGGGAAGMMAAYAAAKNGAQVTLYEKNEKLGKKIYITGKGRCNVTNDCDRETFFEQIVSNPRFLYSAFSALDTAEVQALLEEGGCPLKVERGGRVFPVSDHASDVIRGLERLMTRAGVKVCLHTGVKEILTEEIKTDGKIRAAACGLRLTDGTTALADRVIIATGGLSYPTTGSTGDGYGWAEALGHRIVPQSPSLVPLVIQEDWCSRLQGLSLKNVELSLRLDEKEIYKGFGEMLFTHFGVSGPLILSASSYYGLAMAKWEKKNEKKRTAKPEGRIFLNLKPALTEEQLDKRLLRDFDAQKNKDFKNALDGLFPARLIPVMLELSGIDRIRRYTISQSRNAGSFGIDTQIADDCGKTGSFAEAVITRGGVNVRDVNPSTMESKVTKGLYFAGEVLDMDALTGGFNLQIAWSTGYLAGMSAVLQEDE